MAMPDEVREWCARTGRPLSGGLVPPELVQEYDTLVELGLVDPPRRTPVPSGCHNWMADLDRYCRMPQLGQTGYCVYHGGSRLQQQMTAAQHRETIVERVLPQAVQKLAEILHDDEAKDEVVVRAAFGVLDRVGLGPVQGILLDANVNTRLPRDQMSELLGAIADRLAPAPAGELEGELVEEAELVDDQPESSEPVAPDLEAAS